MDEIHQIRPRAAKILYNQMQEQHIEKPLSPPFFGDFPMIFP